MYAETYRPRKLSEVAGQPAALKELVSWFNTWPEQKKAAILYGRAGTGKTSAVIALGKEVGADLIELNASNQRTYDVIMRVVGNAATSSTLEGNRKIILLDEADNVFGKEDKGGNQAIAEIIDFTRNPIVLIANEYWEIPQNIRQKAKMIEFRALQPASVLKVLKRVKEEENLQVRDEVLTQIAENAHGDLRAALNDLESVGEKEYFNPRDTQISIFQALSSLFRAHSVEVRKEFINLDMEPRQVLLWVAQNTPLVYEPPDAAQAYYYLSRADVFLGRVMRTQYYKLWGYATDLMTAGVSLARSGKFRFERFQQPAFFGALAGSKKEREMKQQVCEKVGGRCHCSLKEAEEYVRILRALENQVERAASLCVFFGFDEEEVLYIFKKGEKVWKAMETVEREGKKEIKAKKMDGGQTTLIGR